MSLSVDAPISGVIDKRLVIGSLILVWVGVWLVFVLALLLGMRVFEMMGAN